MYIRQFDDVYVQACACDSLCRTVTKFSSFVIINMHVSGLEAKANTGQLLSENESSVLSDGRWLTAGSSTSVTIAVS